MSGYQDIVAEILSKVKPTDTLNGDRAKLMALESASLGTETPIDVHRQPEFAKHVEVQSWLPMAAEEYEISKNISDYVVVPVIIAPTDLPNRNSVAYPFETLTRFSPRQGRLNYKSWLGKPTYTEHNHFKVEEAKGIVFDTYMAPINYSKGNLWKVCALCGFDRTKDPELCNAILSGERKSYSMGAFITQYECSICGCTSKQGKLNTECGHVIRGRPKFYETKHGILPSYLLARIGIEGFEVSSVATPAWSSATTSTMFDMARF